MSILDIIAVRFVICCTIMTILYTTISRQLFFERIQPNANRSLEKATEDQYFWATL